MHEAVITFKWNDVIQNVAFLAKHTNSPRRVGNPRHPKQALFKVTVSEDNRRAHVRESIFEPVGDGVEIRGSVSVRLLWRWIAVVRCCVPNKWW